MNDSIMMLKIKKCFFSINNNFHSTDTIWIPHLKKWEDTLVKLVRDIYHQQIK